MSYVSLGTYTLDGFHCPICGEVADLGDPMIPGNVMAFCGHYAIKFPGHIPTRDELQFPRSWNGDDDHPWSYQDGEPIPGRFHRTRRVIGDQGVRVEIVRFGT